MCCAALVVRCGRTVRVYSFWSEPDVPDGHLVSTLFGSDLDVPDWVRRVLSLWSSLTVHCVVVCVVLRCVCAVWTDGQGLLFLVVCELRGWGEGGGQH